MQPKHYKSPKIILLNIELELKSERDNAEIRIDNVEEYQSVVDAEWTILYEKLQKIVDSGAKVVLSKLPIGDVATQYFADRYGACWHGGFFSCDTLLLYLCPWVCNRNFLQSPLFPALESVLSKVL